VESLTEKVHGLGAWPAPQEFALSVPVTANVPIAVPGSYGSVPHASGARAKHARAATVAGLRARMTMEVSRPASFGQFPGVGLAQWTAWDRRTFARGAAVALATLALAFVVTAASDEGGLAWGVRAGRALPLAPVCAAVGAWLALAPGRARGEELALAASGRSPWECHAAAIVGGAVVALGAAVAIAAVSRVDVRGFYPRAEAALAWHPESGETSAKGAVFRSDDGRWRIAANGEPIFDAEAASLTKAASELPHAARVAAALATAFAGLALPMLAARARSKRAMASAFAAIVAAALVTVLAFQAAAIARAPALLAPVGPLLLLAAAASGYRSSPWRRARYPR